MNDCPDTTMYCHKCSGIMAIENDREFICGCGYRCPVLSDENWDDVKNWVSEKD